MRKFSTVLTTAAVLSTAILAASPAQAAEVTGGIFVGFLGPIIELCWGFFAAIFGFFGWTF